MELKRIGVASAAKVGAMMGLIWGIIMAVVILAFAMPSIVALMSLFGMASLATLGAAAVVATLIIGGIIWGLIGGALAAVIYNIAAKYVGGVQLDLK